MHIHVCYDRKEMKKEKKNSKIRKIKEKDKKGL